MCSARVDLAHMFRAFSNGVDGVFIGGCHINDCHYITNGNYNALGMDKDQLKFKMEAVTRLIPYIKLVERERLRAPLKLRTSAEPEEAHDKFFESDELNRLFNETIVDKLAICQIMLLLQEKPLSTGEISEKLNLNPSETARHMSSSSRHGLVRNDERRKCFAPAQAQS